MATPLRIGLTGGIGSGKSVAAACLARLGAVVIDADALSRSLTAPGGAAINAIATAFGAEMIGRDGALDRERMRTLAFGDPGARGRLEAILHPMIASATQAAAAAAHDAPAIVFDVPLLAESADRPGGWRDRVHRILVIDCREETQIERVMQRSGWTRETVQRVIDQQARRKRRRAIADAVIFNDGLTLAAFEAEVTIVYQRWAKSHERL